MSLKKPLVLYAGFVKELASGDTIGANDQVGEEAVGSTASSITLNNTPITGTLKVYKNGMRLPASKFSLSGAIVTLTNSRSARDLFQFDYKY